MNHLSTESKGQSPGVVRYAEGVLEKGSMHGHRISVKDSRDALNVAILYATSFSAIHTPSMPFHVFEALSMRQIPISFTPPLPLALVLTPAEEEQLRRWLKWAPASSQSLTKMDVLALKIYSHIIVLLGERLDSEAALNQSSRQGSHQDAPIQAACYALGHTFNVSEENNSVFQVLQGNINVLNTPQMQTYDLSLTPLPLTSDELQQLQRILKRSPPFIQYLTLMEVLGLHVYSSLSSLCASSQPSSVLLNRFCKDWLIGRVCRADQFRCQAAYSYTSIEFVKAMKKTHQELARMGEKSKFKQKYKDACHGIALLLKLWEKEGSVQFLNCRSCSQFTQLSSWVPREKKNHKKFYEVIHAFIDFALCAFQQTKDFQLRAHSQKIMIQDLQQIKNVYAFVYGAQEAHSIQSEGEEVEAESLKTDELLELIACAQKKMLEKYMVSMERSNVKFRVLDSMTVETDGYSASILEGHREAIYLQFLKNIHGFLEDYVVQVVPTHITIHAHFTRAAMTYCRLSKDIVRADQLKTGQRMYVSQVDKAKQSSPSYSKLVPIEARGFASLLLPSMHQDQDSLEKKIKMQWLSYLVETKSSLSNQLDNLEMQFLSQENYQGFFELSLAITSDLQASFEPGRALVQHTYEKQESNLEGVIRASSWLNIISEYKRMYPLQTYQILYPLITEFLETLYTTLDVLQKKHTEQCIQLLDRLSVETCRTHQKAILDFFANLLFKQMGRVCLTYILQQDLYFFSQDATTKEPLDFLKTPMMAYLLMEDFERAFFEKITLDELTRVQDTLEPIVELSDQSIAVSFESLLRVHVPHEKKAPPSSEKAKALPKKTENALFLLRRGEKERNILKKLRALGLEWSRQKGSHARFENNEGAQVTIPLHGDRHLLSPKVRSSLVKQLNKKGEK